MQRTLVFASLLLACDPAPVAMTDAASPAPDAGPAAPDAFVAAADAFVAAPDSSTVMPTPCATSVIFEEHGVEGRAILGRGDHWLVLYFHGIYVTLARVELDGTVSSRTDLEGYPSRLFTLGADVIAVAQDTAQRVHFESDGSARLYEALALEHMVEGSMSADSEAVYGVSGYDAHRRWVRIALGDGSSGLSTTATDFDLPLSTTFREHVVAGPMGALALLDGDPATRPSWRVVQIGIRDVPPITYDAPFDGGAITAVQYDATRGSFVIVGSNRELVPRLYRTSGGAPETMSPALDGSSFLYGIGYGEVARSSSGGTIVGIVSSTTGGVPMPAELRIGASPETLGAPIREGATVRSKVHVAWLGSGETFGAIFGLDAIDTGRSSETQLGFRCFTR